MFISCLTCCLALTTHSKVAHKHKIKKPLFIRSQAVNHANRSIKGFVGAVVWLWFLLKHTDTLLLIVYKTSALDFNLKLHTLLSCNHLSPQQSFRYKV